MSGNKTYEVTVLKADKDRVWRELSRLAFLMDRHPRASDDNPDSVTYTLVYSARVEQIKAVCQGMSAGCDVKEISGDAYDGDWESFRSVRVRGRCITPKYGFKGVVAVERTVSGVGILKFAVDAQNAPDDSWPALSNGVVALVKNRQPVIVDLDQVQFISSAVLGKLVMLFRLAKEAGITVRFANAAPEFLETMAPVRRNKLFEFYDDLDTALAQAVQDLA